jgi:glycosyltransferase involved in cell wall biosynthesis
MCYEYFLDSWFRTPDSYWTWRRPALAVARRLIREHDIPLVFTSADPYTTHLIGLDLQRDGCRWVADLRDPHAYNAHSASPYFPVYAKQIAAERAAVRSADAVTVAAEAIAMIVTDMHGQYCADRLHFIPTGLDEDLIPDPAPAHKPYPYLLFSGEYLDAYGTGFLEVFSRAVRTPEVQKLGHKLLIVGRLDINSRLRPIIRDLGLKDRIELIDHMPQRELYQLLLGASAGVILSTRLFRWWCLYAKMVDYIALRKPVVALVPDPSEARTRLTKAGLGVFLDGDLEQGTDKLVNFLSGEVKLPEPDEAECRRYLASSQVSEFVKVFEKVVGEQPPTTVHCTE